MGGGNIPGRRTGICKGPVARGKVACSKALRER